MRYLIIVVVIALAVIYVGGAVNIGKAPIFAHLDGLMRSQKLMKLHYSVFWLLYRGEGTASSGIYKTKQDVKEFEQRPAGIDNKAKYKQLDEAAGN